MTKLLLLPILATSMLYDYLTYLQSITFSDESGAIPDPLWPVFMPWDSDPYSVTKLFTVSSQVSYYFLYFTVPSVVETVPFTVYQSSVNGGNWARTYPGRTMNVPSLKAGVNTLSITATSFMNVTKTYTFLIQVETGGALEGYSLSTNEGGLVCGEITGKRTEIRCAKEVSSAVMGLNVDLKATAGSKIEARHVSTLSRYEPWAPLPPSLPSFFSTSGDNFLEVRLSSPLPQIYRFYLSKTPLSLSRVRNFNVTLPGIINYGQWVNFYSFSPRPHPEVTEYTTPARLTQAYSGRLVIVLDTWGPVMLNTYADTTSGYYTVDPYPGNSSWTIYPGLNRYTFQPRDADIGGNITFYAAAYESNKNVKRVRVFMNPIIDLGDGLNRTTNCSILPLGHAYSYPAYLLQSNAAIASASPPYLLYDFPSTSLSGLQYVYPPPLEYSSQLLSSGFLVLIEPESDISVGNLFWQFVQKDYLYLTSNKTLGPVKIGMNSIVVRVYAEDYMTFAWILKIYVQSNDTQLSGVTCNTPGVRLTQMGSSEYSMEVGEGVGGVGGIDFQATARHGNASISIQTDLAYTGTNNTAAVAGLLSLPLDKVVGMTVELVVFAESRNINRTVIVVITRTDVCGNGARWSNSEECDTGSGQVAGSGCFQCMVETGWTCSGGSATAPDICQLIPLPDNTTGNSTSSSNATAPADPAPPSPATDPSLNDPSATPVNATTPSTPTTDTANSTVPAPSSVPDNSTQPVPVSVNTTAGNTTLPINTTDSALGVNQTGNGNATTPLDPTGNSTNGTVPTDPAGNSTASANNTDIGLPSAPPPADNSTAATPLPPADNSTAVNPLPPVNTTDPSTNSTITTPTDPQINATTPLPPDTGTTPSSNSTTTPDPVTNTTTPLPTPTGNNTDSNSTAAADPTTSPTPSPPPSNDTANNSNSTVSSNPQTNGTIPFPPAVNSTSSSPDTSPNNLTSTVSSVNSTIPADPPPSNTTVLSNNTAPTDLPTSSNSSINNTQTGSSDQQPLNDVNSTSNSTVPAAPAPPPLVQPHTADPPLTQTTPISPSPPPESSSPFSTPPIPSPSSPIPPIPPYNTTTTPHPPTLPVCGDGFWSPPEYCDDGNLLPHDGCSPSCTIDSNWTCAHRPSLPDQCSLITSSHSLPPLPSYYQITIRNYSFWLVIAMCAVSLAISVYTKVREVTIENSPAVTVLSLVTQYQLFALVPDQGSDQLSTNLAGLRWTLFREFVEGNQPIGRRMEGGWGREDDIVTVSMGVWGLFGLLAVIHVTIYVLYRGFPGKLTRILRELLTFTGYIYCFLVAYPCLAAAWVDETVAWTPPSGGYGGVSLGVYLIVSGIVLGAPGTVMVFLRVNRRKLMEGEFGDRFGALFEGLKVRKYSAIVALKPSQEPQDSSPIQVISLTPATAQPPKVFHPLHRPSLLSDSDFSDDQPHHSYIAQSSLIALPRPLFRSTPIDRHKRRDTSGGDIRSFEEEAGAEDDPGPDVSGKVCYYPAIALLHTLSTVVLLRTAAIRLISSFGVLSNLCIIGYSLAAHPFAYPLYSFLHLSRCAFSALIWLSFLLSSLFQAASVPTRVIALAEIVGMSGLFVVIFTIEQAKAVSRLNKDRKRVAPSTQVEIPKLKTWKCEKTGQPDVTTTDRQANALTDRPDLSSL